ncbi:hypothetical protein CF319_g8656 [Tilletia indica]|nr:hypothetical protein CF319_g8656 [Tilletia indica]
MSDNTSKKHVVFFGGTFWGHARPALHYCIRFCLRSPNLAVSLLLPEDFVVRATKAIDLMIAEQTPDATLAKDVRARIKFGPLTLPADYECPDELKGSFAQPVKEASAALIAYWERIHKEPQELPLPSMLIVDFFTDYEREHIKAINDVPILFWWSSNLN